MVSIKIIAYYSILRYELTNKDICLKIMLYKRYALSTFYLGGTMKHPFIGTLSKAIIKTASESDRDLAMPANRRYWPKELIPYFGYDQWVLWLAAVELAWLYLLCHIDYAPIPEEIFSEKFILGLFKKLTTLKQDELEKSYGHDINALIAMLKENLPKEAHSWIHHGMTSYDTIEAARALMLRLAFKEQLVPLLISVDKIWREKINCSARIIQMGRTHLQDALPVTVGFWLAVIHERFTQNSRQAYQMAQNLTGKLSGACGTSASFVALGIEKAYRKKRPLGASMETYFLEEILDLGAPRLSTQITPPETMLNFLFSLYLLSGSLAQLGEDGRILQSSAIREMSSVSSTSSTMAHKRGNPVAAENMAGMFWTVMGELIKHLSTPVSDLQRDLRGSGPARDIPALMIYVFRQLKTAERFLNNLTINEARCAENLDNSKFSAMGELLYLALSQAGISDAHQLVNKVIVPEAMVQEVHLGAIVMRHFEDRPDLEEAWSKIPEEVKNLIRQPEDYLGNAIAKALEEGGRNLHFEEE